MHRTVVFGVFGLVGCNAVQDVVPGGVCSWVEQESTRQNCVEIVVTTESATSANDYDTRREYDDFGLASFQEITGRPALSGASEVVRDSRGRIIEQTWRDGQVETRTWDGCFEGSRTIQPDEGTPRTGAFTYRNAAFESYTLTDSGGDPYTVREYLSEWDGQDVVSEEVWDDGELIQQMTHTYSKLGGTVQHERFSGAGDGSQLSRTVTLLNGDDRPLLVEVYDALDELFSAHSTVFTQSVETTEYDEDGDGVVDYVDRVSLDDLGRRTRTERISSDPEDTFDFVRTHTWVCE